MRPKSHPETIKNGVRKRRPKTTASETDFGAKTSQKEVQKLFRQRPFLPLWAVQTGKKRALPNKGCRRRFGMAFDPRTHALTPPKPSFSCSKTYFFKFLAFPEKCPQKRAPKLQNTSIWPPFWLHFGVRKRNYPPLLSVLRTSKIMFSLKASINFRIFVLFYSRWFSHHFWPPFDLLFGSILESE